MPGILVFDVETTGLPMRQSFYKRFPEPVKFEFYNGSRIVEIAYKVYDEHNQLVKALSVLIKPNDFEIQNSDIHGITQDMANKYGTRIDIALANFLIDVDNVDILVSHNMEFDLNIVLAEMWRMMSLGQNTHNINYLDIETLTSKHKVCTMKAGQKQIGYIRYPKLVDLYTKLCGNTNWKQEHRALDDVDKCAQCYFKLNII
jgi:DNA polymerase III subunit alpha